MHCAGASWRTPRSDSVRAVADDDWRVTVTLHDQAHAQRAMESVREQEEADDAQGRLSYHVAVSADGLSVFLYAGTEDAARTAGRVMRDVLARQQLSADFALSRWYPLREEWQDPDTPTPTAAGLRHGEHQQPAKEEEEEEEARQLSASGPAGWEVRVDMPSHHEAVALAGRLRADGRPVIRRRKYLLLGASSAAEASDLAEAIEQELPAGASVHPRAVPFTQFGRDEMGSGPMFPLT
jgi:hypothetical protein